MKNVSYLMLVLLIAGCTTQAGPSNTENNENIGTGIVESFVIDDSMLSHSYDELPMLSSSMPGPDSSVPVNNIIILFFKENNAYSNYEIDLYENGTSSPLSTATSTFDSFISTDFGIKPLSNGEIIALKPNTAYIVKLDGLGGTYYYAFTTESADTTPPLVSGAYFEGNELAILFSERVKALSINSTNIRLERDGTVITTGNFAGKRTLASQMYEDKKYFIPYSDLTPGDYRITINGVLDTSNNRQTLVYTTTFTK